jgi:hypothetical protein
MSRPRTPLYVLEARGSIKKDPQRYRERQEQARKAPKAEPVGPPPSRWTVFHPLQARACELFSAGEGLNAVAAALEIPWEKARELKDAQVAFREGPRLCAIWAEFAPQVTIRTPMRRALLEQFVVAMDKFRRLGETMRTSEKNNLLSLTARLELDQRLPSVGKGVRGEDGTWEEYD